MPEVVFEMVAEANDVLSRVAREVNGSLTQGKV